MNGAEYFVTGLISTATLISFHISFPALLPFTILGR